MSSNTKAGGKDVKETTASVKLNQMSGGMAPAQGNSVLLEGAGGDGAGGKGGEGSEEDEAKKRAKAALAAKKAGKSSGPGPEAVATLGDPVDAITGNVVDNAIEFVLPGAIAITWERTYSSARHAEYSSMGRGGWCHAYDQWIDRDVGDDGEPLLHLRDHDGRDHYFEFVAELACTYHRRMRYTITGRRSGGYDLYDHESRLTRTFLPTGADSDRARLHAICDQHGNIVRFQYAGDQLTNIVDTASREIRLLRDRDGRIIRIEIWASAPVPPLPRGATPLPPKPLELQQWVDHTYHVTDELASITDALGHRERFEYDGHHRMVQTTLKNGVSFHYRYDEDTGRCIKTWGDGGLHRVDFQFEGAGNATTVGGTNEPRTYVHDSAGRIVEERTHDGAFVIKREFDDDGYLLCETNAAGEAVAHEYDAAGFRTKTIDPAGNETHWHYDADLLVERVEPGDQRTAYSYDARGKLIGITSSSGLSYTILHDATGRLTGIDGPDGHLLRIKYDSHHNRAQTVDSRGAKTLFGYDAMGRPRLRIDALARRLSATLDQLGQPVEVMFPDGTRTEMRYDPLGNLCSVVDSVGQTTTMAHAGTGVLRRLVRADGLVWTFDYDSDERLLSVTNPRAERYTYEYDSAGRVEREHTFDGRVLDYRYSQSGSVARIDYPDETWREFAYDPLGNLVEDRSPHGDVTYERDRRGLLLRSVVTEYNAKIENVFDHDAMGRVVRETQQGRVIAYAYDARSRRASREMPNGELTEYQYDIGGAVVGVRHNGVHVAIERNIMGQETKRELGKSGASLVSAYDAMGRLTEQKVDAPAPRGQAVQRALVGRAFQYGALGWVQRIDDKRSGATSYRYDSIGQLLEAARADFVEAYSYDAVGSLVQALHSLQPAGAEEPWATQPGNILTKAADQRFENDVCGRRKAKIATVNNADGSLREERTEYDWDCRDRLREVRLPDGRRVLYTYDAFARRVRKEVIPAARNNYVGMVELMLESGIDVLPRVEVTEYLWDGDVLAAEIGAAEPADDGGTNNSGAIGAASDRDRPRAPAEQVDVNQRGQRGPPGECADVADGEPRIWRVFVHEPRTFIPMLQSERGRVYFYINDHLGMPKELVDEEGRLAWAARHTAWGAITDVTRDAGTAAVSTPFRMLGQYEDEDIGLCYTRFRWFDARLGRWCSPDPLGLVGGANLLAFDAAPTGYIDPLGLTKRKGTQRWEGQVNQDGSPRRKPGPKPDGPHNDQIEAMIARETAAGAEHIGGGIYRGVPEMVIDIPDGHKTSRRPDASFRDPDTGEVYHYNVGRKNQRAGTELNGVDPVIREREALADLRGAGQTVHFEPYEP